MPRLNVVVAACAAAVVINEVLYDPPGTDGGHEFVELFNSGSAPAELSGYRLLFLNGSEPERSATLWTAESGLSLAPGAYFVLGGDQVGERDRTIASSLQNGDEALVLEHQGVRVDAVAWGEQSGLGEGTPVGTAAGAAIGRVPDGHDLDDNASDFEVLPAPTPGSPNRPAERFDLATWWTVPTWREDAGSMTLELRLVASGWRERQSGWLEVWGETHSLDAAAGDTLAVSVMREVRPGPAAALLRVRGSDPGWSNDLELPIHCGVAALVIVEVQPRPDGTEPEWIELLNRTDEPVALAGWSIRDRGGASRELRAAWMMAPRSRVVFTADAPALALAYPEHAGEFFEVEGGWPTLNDGDPGGGVAADSLHLVAPELGVVDLVTWVSADVEVKGRALQRSSVRPGVASFWLPAVEAPVPGGETSGEWRTWPSRGLSCAPDPFTPDGDGVGDVLEILLVEDDVRRVAVFDLQGDVVRELEVVAAGGRAVARWDGTDGRGRPVPGGAWVVVAESGAGPGTLRRVVGLGRRR